VFTWRPRPATRRVILHGGTTTLDAPAYPMLLAKGRAKGLLSVGYHFVIERCGTVCSGRPLEAVGSHTSGYNEDSVGVFMAGPGPFCPEQRQALAGLMFRLRVLYPGLPLIGHKELPRTRSHQCPDVDMDELRSFIEREISTMATEPTKTPKASGDGSHLTAQQQLLVDYMKAGRTLTTQIALVQLGIMSLSSRIAELRAMGYDIQSERKEDFHGSSYYSYTLADADQ
jgi:hypothetical protein